MTNTFVHLAAVFALASTAFARLGDSFAQCTARYGEPVTSTTDPQGLKTYFFNKKEMQIIAIFIEDYCAVIAFQKADRSPFSSADLKALLKANAAGNTEWALIENNTFPEVGDKWKQKKQWEQGKADLYRTAELLDQMRLEFSSSRYYISKGGSSK